MALLTKIAIFLPLSCFALTTKPWLSDLFEADLIPRYTYRHYPDVQGATKPFASNDQILSIGLGATLSTHFDFELELEVANTAQQSWGMRSGAMQMRYLWLDDVAGDPISFLTGLSLRDVSKRNLRDVGCPYSARINWELFSAIGKEFSDGANWTTRIYAWLAAGIATRGSWWTRQEISYENNWCNRHHLKLFLQGDFGFGDLRQVVVDHFNGWGRYHHQSIDLGICYRCQLDYYGTFSLSYAYRVFARTFPERVHCLTLLYCFPFCLF
ncbi:hypothetical protein RHABOEDO_000775 [Candidatus Rhabdochlamydia oedothoracis]|uniref:Uncharacterized protein n=1 Tax=Candidatus Rhabdochlamydia oedothoracis TaxID=2720720 RepID=A0ABX8V052_9BACT|nr:MULTISPECIES: hypothetical protein [Rhabdochlamydia]KAG6559687.1 hypothetical protein RHOW815_000279 [Candidatus Rhabdochlamydia sp. W815]QYF48588.1 hypothetical protein RHABOEDO_000775 [Candidatus Rhabdochlamydia oedothoracis]